MKSTDYANLDESDVEKADEQASSAPSDPYSMAYIIMVLLGCGTLFPYNTLVTAVDYFELEYPDFDLEYYIPLIMNISSPIIILALVKWAYLMSYTSRITPPFVAITVLIVAVPLVASVTGQTTGLWITMLFVLVFGFFTALLQGSLFAYAAMLPPVYTQAIMAGQGYAGVVVSFCRIFTKVGFPDDDAGLRDGALLYFCLSALVTLICAASFLVMQRMPFVEYYTKQQAKTHPNAMGYVMQEDGDPAPVNSSDPDQVQYMAVFHKVKLQAINVWVVFFITFLVFPGLLTKLTSSYGLDSGWFSIILFTEFNCLDLLGRSLPKYFLAFSPSKLWIPIISRIVLFILFMLCNTPQVFINDIFPYCFMLVFALSNGYLASLAMMYGSGEDIPDHEKGTAGTIMSLCLNTGILMGSAAAIGLTHLGVGG